MCDLAHEVFLVTQHNYENKVLCSIHDNMIPTLSGRGGVPRNTNYFELEPKSKLDILYRQKYQENCATYCGRFSELSPIRKQTFKHLQAIVDDAFFSKNLCNNSAWSYFAFRRT